ncbi:unnamed protein product [Cuscuta epithymum]|uniref:MtN19-like protein n=1 Tax=Cuscuta epithymum TaxID=186058 RepID=A0AAV0GJU2_9ASTE|nr:unnamed protein product [Cuscuta epithymum]
MMETGSRRRTCLLLLLLITIPVLLVIAAAAPLSSQQQAASNKGLKTATFRSPAFELEPGSVANKYFYNLGFPKGHIAVKGFDAEVVDEAGNSIPLHETYLHHWLVGRYYVLKGGADEARSGYISAGNAGFCRGLPQYFGLGSETRKTDTRVPDPYGIEVGRGEDIPEGYEEGWLLNLHAIDTRGAVDKLGCAECRCALYNVSVDEKGKALEKGYVGGLACCYDGTRCRVNATEAAGRGRRRRLYLQYTVTYLNWDSSIRPLKIYIFDVTDSWNMTTPASQGHHCKIEFDVDSCSAQLPNNDELCIHTRTAISSLPIGGDLIYGVAHQHTGGVGSALYGEDGRTLCSSVPIYGKGKEPGNEAGFIVGMRTCYPQPGSVKIAKGEKLTIVSNYSSTQSHTGVMGLFYILVAEPLQTDGAVNPMYGIWGLLALCGVAVLLVGAVLVKRSWGRKDGYESLIA